MDKKIVLPGEKVFDEPKRIPGCFVEGGKTFASTIALLEGEKLVPLKGTYTPRVGDLVVGIVKEESFNGYRLDINSPYEGQLSAREREPRESRQRFGERRGAGGERGRRGVVFELGDVIAAEVVEVNEVHDAVLGRPRQLKGGEILEIEPAKVPRVIGRGGSMLSVIRQFTRADIFVGKNGRVYLKGGDTALATLAILRICREAHLSGVTDRITAFLQSESAAKNTVQNTARNAARNAAKRV